MADYIIYQNGEEINTIVADEDFCRAYCEENGYTYELRPEPEPSTEPEEPTDTDPDVWDELDAAYQEGVNSAYAE